MYIVLILDLLNYKIQSKEITWISRHFILFAQKNFIKRWMKNIYQIHSIQGRKRPCIIVTIPMSKNVHDVFTCQVDTQDCHRPSVDPPWARSGPGYSSPCTWSSSVYNKIHILRNRVYHITSHTDMWLYNTTAQSHRKRWLFIEMKYAMLKFSVVKSFSQSLF